MTSADPAAGLHRRGSALPLAPLLPMPAVPCRREQDRARQAILRDPGDARRVRLAGPAQLVMGWMPKSA